MSPPTASPRILVVPLRYIGDTILTIPLLRKLRVRFPDAQLDVLSSAVTAPLLEPCPYINHVIIEPRSTGQRFQVLRQGRYDAVFFLRKSVTMALMAYLAGIKTRVGYDKQRFPFGYKRWGLFLTAQARYPSLKTDTPQAISHLGLFAAFENNRPVWASPQSSTGPHDRAVSLSPSWTSTVQAEAMLEPSWDSRLELWSTAADEQAIDVLLRTHGLQHKPLAGLHVASASHGKQIALDKFVDSLQRLHQHGYQVLATGTRQDYNLYETLKTTYHLPIVNLAGSTSLRETFTLYKRLNVLLTVDSSPIHLAAAAGVPHVVGVFGPTNERQWGPHHPQVDFRPVFLDLPCRPCYAKVCSHNNCRELLTAEQIANALPLPD